MNLAVGSTTTANVPKGFRVCVCVAFLLPTTHLTKILSRQGPSEACLCSVVGVGNWRTLRTSAEKNGVTYAFIRGEKDIPGL